ncbi:MAG: sugar phosphate isomerase/epimerase family protein [Pirellulaceae bacterium]
MSQAEVKTAITISLVPQARGGPFVFWDDLKAGCQVASQLGYDAVEIFAPSAKAVEPKEVGGIVDSLGLQVAALGTGAGWVLHGLSLSDADNTRRQHAVVFVREMMDAAAALNAPAIIGSMQGKATSRNDIPDAVQRLQDSLEVLLEHADAIDQVLLIEPLNRYETNLINTIDDGRMLCRQLGADHLRLLADLFHMNIEETDLADGIVAGQSVIGHIHFVDSNRRFPGAGHIPYAPVVSAIRQISFDGYLSIEGLPWPSSDGAAAEAIRFIREIFAESP